MPQKPPGKGGWDTTTTTRDGERGDSSLLRSGQGATYRCSPLPHMDTIWMWNTMHACSAGPVGRLACGEPSFTPTLNTTTPAVSLSSASQCSVHSPTSDSSLSEPATRGLAGQRARSHATGVPLRLPPQGRRPVLLTRLSSVRHRLHSECRGPRRCTRQQVVRRYRSPRREALQGRGLARAGVPLRLPPQGRRPVLLTRLSSVRRPRPVSSACTR